MLSPAPSTLFTPIKLIELKREGLLECEHQGFIKLCSLESLTLCELGNDEEHPFFLRSLAKPFQASLIFDYGQDLPELSLEELALCCASHAGEEIHINTIKKLMQKMGITEDLLQCPAVEPISKSARAKLLISGQKFSALHNNCSAKHVLMLAISKQQGWDLKTYLDFEHPIQKAILNSQIELCALDSKPIPRTKDGCGAPVYAMSLKNIARGYLNLFCSPKYELIRQAFIEHPYLIGGETRQDTMIMTASKLQPKNLIAKVGAEGLIVIVNLEKKQALIIKILDCSQKARFLTALHSLLNLGWLESEDIENSEMKRFYDSFLQRSDSCPHFPNTFVFR